MSKQKFKIKRSFVSNLLFSCCGAVLLLLAALALYAPITPKVSAAPTPIADVTDGLSVTIGQPLEATLNPEEENSFTIIKDTVTGATNSPYGYELYVSTNSDSVNDLHLDGNVANNGNRQKILATTGTFDEPAALASANGSAWGYAVAGLNSFDAAYSLTTPSAESKFAAMPTINNKQLIHFYNSAIASDPVDVYYGIKATSDLAAGLYETEIVYTVLPILPPSTPKAILGANGNLNLVYDFMVYTEGDTYTDNLGATEIVKVFDIPEDGVVDPWTDIAYSHKDSVTSINIEESFHDFEPGTVAYWFNDMQHVTSITNIENLNTSKAESAEYLFCYLGRDVDTLDMGNVKLLDFKNIKSAQGMFYAVGYRVTDLVLNLDDMDFENVITMQDIFDDFGFEATNITLSLKNWNVPNLVNLYMGFYDLGDFSDKGTVYIDVSGWKLGSLRNMHYAFYCVGYRASSLTLIGLSDWDVSTVNDAGYAFCSVGRATNNLEVTIENWNLGTKGGVNAEWMFYNIGYDVRGDVILNFSGWSFGVINTDHMFTFAGGGTHTKFHADFSNWKFKIGSLATMFQSIGSSSGSDFEWQVDVTGWDLGDVSVLKNLFYDSGYGATSYTIIGLDTWDVSKVFSMESMFNNAASRASTWSIGDISGWNVENVTNMSSMFNNAGYNATTWNLGNLDRWDVGNVTNMSYMFQYAGHKATNWNIGDISGWNVENVTNYDGFINPTADYYSSPSPDFINASVVMNQPNWP